MTPGSYDVEPDGDATCEELQRRLPKPSRRVPRWFRPDEPPSEKQEVVEGALEAVGNFGALGAVVAIPADDHRVGATPAPLRDSELTKLINPSRAHAVANRPNAQGRRVPQAYPPGRP